MSLSNFVTVIGGANIDIHGKSHESLRPNDSNPGSVHTAAGGVARNIAENLARLGVDSRLISAIGDDQHGQTLLRLCRDAGMNTQYIHEIAGAATSTYLSVLDDTGDLSVGINDMSIIEHLDVTLLQTQQAMLGQSSLIILDCNLPDGTLAWLTGTFTSTPIFADTVSTTKALRIKPYLQFIHSLKTGTIEAEALTGLEAQSETQLLAVVDQLHNAGVERVFVTRGSQGVFYSSSDAQGTQKMQRDEREIKNAGGAGDAFLAGLAYAWLEDWPLEKSVQFSLAAADITLSHPATSSPALSLATIDEVLEMQRAGQD